MRLHVVLKMCDHPREPGEMNRLVNWLAQDVDSTRENRALVDEITQDYEEPRPGMAGHSPLLFPPIVAT